MRSTSQAQVTPSTAQAEVETTTSDTVLRSSSHTRGRTTSATASDQPWPSAFTRTTTIGSTDTAVTSTAASTSAPPAGDGCRRGAGPARRPGVVVVTVR